MQFLIVLIFSIFLSLISNGLADSVNIQNANLQNFYFGTTINGNFYPFYIEMDSLNNSSPANMGTIEGNNGVTAGQYGKVETSGTGFKFATSGASTKFFGTNITYNGCAPTNAQADWMANSLNFFGFNLVRMHECDNFAPAGIIGNTNPPTTTTFDSTALGEFDYLLKDLKNKGIYWDINTNTYRPFTVADGVTDAGSILNLAKGITIFDSTLISLEKSYDYALFTHVNPYTSIAYKDDPAVAWIEITNENSLYQEYMPGAFYDLTLDYAPEWASQQQPSFYIEELATLYNTWLQNKYSTPAAAISAWGLSSLTAPTTIVDNSTEWQNQTLGDATAPTITFNSGVTTINYTNQGSLDWYLQYLQPFNQVSGQYYSIFFNVTSSINTQITMTVQSSTNIYLQQSATLTAGVNTNLHAYYVAPANDSGTYVKLLYGGNGVVTGTLVINSASLSGSPNTIDAVITERNKNTFVFTPPHGTWIAEYPTSMQNDISSFLNATTASFYTAMRSYLNSIVGINCLMLMDGGSYDNLYDPNSGLLQYSDFLDVHTYFATPNTIYSDTFQEDLGSELTDSNLGLIGPILTASQITKTVPMSITEWNHTFPNPYSYEGPIMMATYGALHGWNTMNQFAYGNPGCPFNTFGGSFGNPNGCGFFDTHPVAQQMIQDEIASYLFLKGTNVTSNLTNDVLIVDSDQIHGVMGNIAGNTYNLGGITITPTSNGSIFIYSTTNQTFSSSHQLIAVTMGTTQTTGSGWSGTPGNSTYNWGYAPALIERVNSGFLLMNTGSVSVYPMDGTGTVSSSAVPVTISGGNATFNNSTINAPWFVINK